MKNYILSLVISSFLLVPLGSQAQLLEVKETVFGMDCAPCAYGLEKRIQKMDGIQSVSVSLNDGLLNATLKQNNALTLQAIRQAVEESGFRAKEATISVSGTIMKNDSGNYILETSAGERFMLKAKIKAPWIVFQKRTVPLLCLVKQKTVEKTKPYFGYRL